MADFSFKSDPNILASILAAPKEEAQANAQAEAARQARMNNLLNQLQQAGQTLATLPGLRAQTLKNQALHDKLVSNNKIAKLLADADKFTTTPQPSNSNPNATPLPMVQLSSQVPAMNQVGSFNPNQDIVSPMQVQRLGDTSGYKNQVKTLAAQIDPKAFLQAQAGPKQKTLQQSSYTDKDGVVRLTTFNPNTGEYEVNPNAAPKGFANKVQTDPTTGLPIVFSGSTGEARPLPLPSQPSVTNKVNTYEALNPVQRKIVDTAADDVLKDKDVESLNTTMGGMYTLKELLRDNSPQASGAIQGYATRSLGNEKGVTTDRDISRNTGDQSYSGRFKKYIEMASTGKMDEANKKGFLKLVDLIEKKSKARLDGKIDSYVNRVTTRLPNVDREFIRNQVYIGPGIPMGTEQPTTGLNIDLNALDAEIARRNLKGK